MNGAEKVKQYSFVLKQLVSREIKRRYARSYLGIVWSILNPLLSMAVISFVFSQMFIRSIENYPVYYLSGTIIWSMFTGVTNSAMTALVDNKMLLIKSKLPTRIFPLTRAVSSLVNFGFSLVAYLIILLVFKIPFRWHTLLFFVYSIGVFAFSLGLGYLLSVLYVYFGDIKHLYSVLLSLWMFLSAIFYPIEATPIEAQKIIRENPIFLYVNSIRRCILRGELPTSGEWIRMILWSVGMYMLGRFVFGRMKNKIMQRV